MKTRDYPCRRVWLFMSVFGLVVPAGLSAQCAINAQAGPDQWRCSGGPPATLNGSVSGAYQSVFWTPAAGLSNPNSLTPTVSLNQTTTFVLHTQAAQPGANLIVNGNFNQGNTGFTSHYNYNPNFWNYPFGSYDITLAPGPPYTACPGHGGFGPYMCIDGAENPGQLVWCQTVAVTPNTDYLLSTWVTSINSDPLFAQLRFTINGVQVGNLFNAPWQCVWSEFTGNWNSGASTTANICIEDLSVTAVNNDFGLDDIGFFPICTDSDTVTVHVVEVQALAQAAAMLPCEGATIALNGNGSSAGPEVTYQWSTVDGHILSGENSLQPIVDEAGIYTLQVRHDYGSGECNAVATVQVSIDPNGLTAGIDPPPSIDCGHPQVMLHAFSSHPGVQYAWTSADGILSGGQDSDSPTVAAPGLYDLLVTDPATGCQATATATVAANTLPPFLQTESPDTLSCTVPTVSLTAASISGAVFQWTTPDGQIVSGAATASPVVNAPGSYIVQAFDPSNGCMETDTTLVVANEDAPVVQITPPPPFTCTLTSQLLSAQTTSPHPVSWQWTANNGGVITGGADTPTPIAAGAGVYELIIQDLQNGCTASATLNIGLDTLPPALALELPDTLTCLATLVQLAATSAQPNLEYAWQAGPGAHIVSGASTAMPLVDAPGIYTLMATAPQNGCSSQAVVAVYADQAPPGLAIAPPALLTCYQPVDTLYAYPLNGDETLFGVVWNTTDGVILAGANDWSAVIDAAGTYDIVVQNLQTGCTAAASTTVAADQTPPLADAGVAGKLSCAIDSLSLQGMASAGGAGLGIEWTGPGLLSGAGSLSPQVGAPGWYRLDVRNVQNGCTAYDTILIEIDTVPPKLSVALPDLLTCVRKEVELFASASGTLAVFHPSWQTAGGHIVSGANTWTVVVDEAGEYFLTVMNQQNGCSSGETLVVQQNISPPLAEAGPNQILHCNQTQAVLQGSSATPTPVSYFWTASSGGHIASGEQNPSPTVDAAGGYTLMVTRSDNGCTATDSVAVVAIAAPRFQFTVRQPDCIEPTGELTIASIDGGASPYTVSADDGQHFQADRVFDNLSPGPYTLVVRDAYGCTAAREAVLEAPSLPSVQLPAIHTLALGDSLVLHPFTMPAAPLIAGWAWEPPVALSCTDCPEPTAMPLRHQEYRLTITDWAGCTATAETRVLVDRTRQVYAPTVFSPNDDQVNDWFTLFGRGVVEIREIQVYDRWGSLVWERKNLPVNEEKLGWDGRIRGQDAAAGVYVWQAVLLFADAETEVFSGDVTVLR